MTLHSDKSIDHSLIETVRVSSALRLTPAERKGLLWLVDVLVLAVAGLGALWLWTLTKPDPFNLRFLAAEGRWMPVLIVAWNIIAWSLDLYSSRFALKISTVFQRLTAVAVAVLVGYLLIFFAIAPRNMLPRLPLLYFLALATLGSTLWRWAYAATLARGTLQQRILIIGAGWSGRALAEIIQNEFLGEFQLVGFVDDNPAKQRTRLADVPVLGPVNQVLEVARLHGADAVVHAITHQLDAETFHLLLDCQAAGLRVIQMPALYEALTGRVPVEHVRNDWLLSGEVTGGQASLVYRLFVRMLDWGVGLLVGLFLLILGPLVALLIKLDSPGPVFYRQTRLGRGGVPFELIKFRSMVTDAEVESGAQWATQDDPRITRVGRFLRRTRVDELPQIINIMRGDIHLIGPRPERPEFIADLERDVPFYRARLAVKPGLTGWAQVRYRYGNTVEDALIKLEYDLFYVKNRSILLDLLILFRTVAVILTFKGT